MRELGSRPYGKQMAPFALYRCECGNKIERNTRTVNRGETIQCRPCSQKQQAQSIRRHGMSDSRLNLIWRKMKDRCNNKKSDNYIHYGKRGISVCKPGINFYLL